MQGEESYNYCTDPGTAAQRTLQTTPYDKALFDKTENGNTRTHTARRWRPGEFGRRAMALLLSTLMLLVPMGGVEAFAQSPPEEAPLSDKELDRLVAPVALYPDALLAQVLAASTYPVQVVEANRWLKSQHDATREQIAAEVDAKPWDPSVKALTAFPSVLDRMDININWTRDLGNAYYNQPEDVMNSVQAMRRNARAAGNLHSTPQQTVREEDGAVVIVPASPTVVYVPEYDPWLVWGYPLVAYPGFYYWAPPGIFVGGLLIGFGIGIPIAYWSYWGWGWHHWRVRWRDRHVFYNRHRYYTRSRTVVNRGFGRRGGPPRHLRGRGAYVPPGARRFDRRGTPGRVQRPAPRRPGTVRPGPRSRPGGHARPGGGRPGGGRPGGGGRGR